MARFNRDLKLLIAARAFRSLGQGLMVVDFALYLRALHWSAPFIGALLMGALLMGTVLTMLTGPLSDRIGRRKFLLYYEFAQMLAALAGLISSAPALLVPATLIAGFGRGGNGSAGPFAPVEQSWLAQLTTATNRGPIFSVNGAIGSCGMALGALLAMLPAFCARWLPGALAYRPLFGLVLIGSVISFLFLLKAGDAPVLPKPKPEEAQADATHQEENTLLFKLMGINALNGIGIGLVGPLISYWFADRFGVGVERIGPVMGLGFLLTAFSSLASGWLSTRIGVVRSVIAMRAAGLAMLFLLPLMPSFGLAAALHVLRTGLNQGTAGTRQALSMSLVRAHRRGLAASLSNISMQVPRAIGPVFAGLFFHNGMFSLPFFIAAIFQGSYLYLYRRVFLKEDRSMAEK